MSIKDLSYYDRPREKASLKGLDSLTNAELLAILICTGTKEKSALEIAYEMLCEFNGINGIINASTNDLKKIKGISEAKALRIISGLYLYERALLEEAFNSFTIKGIDEIGRYFVSKIGKESQEIGYVVVVDSKNKVINIKELFRGTVTCFNASPQLILKHVMSIGRRFIFIHNHPSGIIEPSEKDLVFTSSLDVASVSVGLEFVDHLIVNENNYLSMRKMFENYN